MQITIVVWFTLQLHALSARIGGETETALETRAAANSKTLSQLDHSVNIKPDGWVRKDDKTPEFVLEHAIGGAQLGIGALIEDYEDTAEWAPWGLALSGNGLMAEAAAAGVLRALNQGGVLDKLSTISSVSGGSWFNTQFAFSQKFYKGVLDEDTPLKKFYTDYQMAAMGGMGSAAGPTWEDMMTAMHDGFDKGQGEMQATNANRGGNKNADLLLCTNLVGGSLMSDNKTVVQLSSNGEKAFYTTPAFWAVPTSGAESWHVPSVDLDAATLTAGEQSTTSVRDSLPAPTVTKISSMSSAANGITANPELSLKFQPHSAYASMFGSYLQPNNGVCTGPTAGDCAFPSMMAIDGCYSDNLGFALNVGYMQKKFPGKHLRLMAVSSELCDRTADPTCIAGVKGSAFRSLFADSPYPAVEGWLPAIVPGPDRTIFAESITDEQALGQATGHGGMTFVTGTFTTVQNTYFGVEAGTKVSIVILNVNGPLYLQGMGPGVPTGGVAGLSDVAVHAHRSMTDMLEAFSKNDKLTSDAAFLYYQTVEA